MVPIFQPRNPRSRKRSSFLATERKQVHVSDLFCSCDESVFPDSRYNVNLDMPPPPPLATINTQNQMQKIQTQKDSAQQLAAQQIAAQQKAAQECDSKRIPKI